MSKTGFTILLKGNHSPLSPHFGKAKWLAVYDTVTLRTDFIRNAGLTGSAMCALLASSGCEEVIFSHIGPGALRQLKAANIAAWYGPEGVPVSDLLDLLRTGRLRLARKPTSGRGRAVPRAA